MNIFKLCEYPEKIIELLNDNFQGLDYELNFDGLDCKLSIYNASEDDIDGVVNLFSNVIYSDEDESLAKCAINLLYENNINVAVAESCTGGMLASMFIDVPGSSEVFYEGLVTYSNASKIDRLSVAIDTISDFGAVSRETSLEMAQGLLQDGVIIGISTTGIAGPQGGSEEKPVGTVYITVADIDAFTTKKYIFSGSRNEIRKYAAQKAIFQLVEFLIKNYKV
ncbi:MAG TPA: nicotinamide-nucleotide amidohydrolase family protein [Clostridiales bacterium]|nr:nicotinamide-nucleotide amidohydrolase family protein [Clostridiales bacterium]